MIFSTSTWATVFCLLPACLAAEGGMDWSYSESSWKRGACVEGKRQSPVDLKGWVNNASLTEIEFSSDYKVAPPEMYLEHMGKTVQITAPGVTMKISGGPLPSSYTFLQLHFHWGLNNTLGSEHTINRFSHAQEFHLVHWNSGKYADVTEAMRHNDGLAVLAIFTAVDEDGTEEINHELELITHYFDQIRKFEDGIAVPFPFPIYNLIPANQQYFTYGGSLTTPNCDEIVIWTVFKNPIYITNSRMEAFRRFKELEGAYLDATHRSVQPINNRHIFLSPIFATLARTTKPPAFPNGQDSRCFRIEKEEAKFVEILDIRDFRSEARLEAFTLTNDDNTNWMLYKQRDRIGFKPSPASPSIPQLEGGGLEHPYHFHDSVFFFSGDDMLYQSPHSFYGRHSPLEIHMLFYDKKDYGSFSEAKKMNRFLIFVLPTKYSANESTAFSAFDEILEQFSQPEDILVKRSPNLEKEGHLGQRINHLHQNNHHHKHNLTKKSISDYHYNTEFYLDFPRHLVVKSFIASLLKTNAGYYKYYGPTTFPHCSSSVQWVVLDDPIALNLHSSRIIRNIHLSFPCEIVPSKKNEDISEILYYMGDKGRNCATKVENLMVMMMMLVVSLLKP